MITKTDVIEEIEKIPDIFLEEVYNYMKYIEFKADSEKKESADWQSLGEKEFFKGYADADSVYDKVQRK
jgi:hypothetical protein